MLNRTKKRKLEGTTLSRKADAYLEDRIKNAKTLNDITPAEWDNSFRNQLETNKSTYSSKHCFVACKESLEGKPCECTKGWNEGRVDIIGSNGNDGLHYDVYDDVDKLYQEK